MNEYSMRLPEETAFRNVKYVTGAMHLHSKLPELMEQEIYSAFIMHNLCSAVIALTPSPCPFTGMQQADISVGTAGSAGTSADCPEGAQIVVCINYEIAAPIIREDHISRSMPLRRLTGYISTLRSTMSRVI